LPLTAVTRHGNAKDVGLSVITGNFAMQVKDMPVQLVPLETTPGKQQKKDPPCRAVLQPQGTREQQQRGETSILQVRA
jgi:hypothetical protein